MRSARGPLSLNQLKSFLNAKSAHTASSTVVRLHRGKVTTGDPMASWLGYIVYGLKKFLGIYRSVTWKEHCQALAEKEMMGLARAMPTYIRGRAVTALQSRKAITLGFLKQAVDELEAEKQQYLRSPDATRGLLRERLQRGELTDPAELEALKRRILYLVQESPDFPEVSVSLINCSIFRKPSMPILEIGIT